MPKPDHDCRKLAAGCADGFAYCCKCGRRFQLVTRPGGIKEVILRAWPLPVSKAPESAG